MIERFKIADDNSSEFENVENFEVVDLYFGEKTLKMLEDSAVGGEYFYVTFNEDGNLFKIRVKITGIALNDQNEMFAINGETIDGKKFEGLDKNIGEEKGLGIGHLRVKIEKGYKKEEANLDPEHDL